MKRWIILAAIVVALSSTATVALQYLPEAGSNERGRPAFPVGSFGGAGDRGKGGPPKAVVEGDRLHNFGTMPQQTTGKHAWIVRNTGRTTLELSMISSTCSCTLAKFKDGEKAYVKPGEKTEIVLEFETRTNNGAYEKGAVIGTNDPDLPEFSLYVKGTVYPALMTMPTLEGNVVNLLTISNDSDHHVNTLGIFSKDRPETKILKATSSNPREVVVSWEPVTGEELKKLKLTRCERLTIDVRAGLPLGVFREEVKITTDHPLQPEMTLIVTGTMQGPITFTPAHLRVPGSNAPGPIVGKVGGSGEVGISVREGRETKFEVIAAPRGLKVEIVPDRTTATRALYRLKVIVPPGTPAQMILDDVVLKTDHPKAGRVVVPVSILISDSQ